MPTRRSLLHLNGSNGSTTVTNDVTGGSAVAWSFGGSAGSGALTTTGPYFGSAMAALPKYATLDSDSVTPSGDWTLAFLLDTTNDSDGGQQCIVSQGKSGDAGSWSLVTGNSETDLYFSTNQSGGGDIGTIYLGNAATITGKMAAGPCFIVVQWISGVLSVGLAGSSDTSVTQILSGSFTGGGSPAGAFHFNGTRDSSNNQNADSYTCRIDEVYYQDGGALYPSYPFTKPTAEYALTPLITADTQQTGSVGGTVTFTPTFSGATSYQWKKNGTDISGATSATYTTPTIVSGDNGAAFTVAATNADGTTLSGTMYLYVRDIATGKGRAQRGWAYQRHQVGITTSMLTQDEEGGRTQSDIWGDWFNLKTSVAGGTSLVPGTGSLTFAGLAPTIAQPKALTPSVGALAFTGYAPTIAQPVALTPTAGSIAFTGYAPALAQSANQSLVPNVSAIALSGPAPTLAQTANQTLVPAVGAVVMSGYAPTLQQTAGLSLTPGAGAIALAGYAPAVARTANQALVPGAASVSFTGLAPVVSQTAGQVLAPGAASLTLAGPGPTIAQTANQALVPATVAVVFSGPAPTLSQTAGQQLSPAAAAVALAGFAPSVAQTLNRSLMPSAGTLALAGYAPELAQSANLALMPSVGALTITGFAPNVAQVSGSPTLTPGPASISVNGLPPTVAQSSSSGWSPVQLKANLKAQGKQRDAKLAKLQADAEAKKEAERQEAIDLAAQEAARKAIAEAELATAIARAAEQAPTAGGVATLPLAARVTTPRTAPQQDTRRVAEPEVLLNALGGADEEEQAEALDLVSKSLADQAIARARENKRRAAILATLLLMDA